MSCVNTAALLDVILLTGEAVWHYGTRRPLCPSCGMLGRHRVPACTSRQVLGAQSMTNAWLYLCNYDSEVY
jgi:hypothetical protein